MSCVLQMLHFTSGQVGQSGQSGQSDLGQMAAPPPLLQAPAQHPQVKPFFCLHLFTSELHKWDSLAG
ncbi:MAG: hypothetical protein ABL974_22020 [Prosthecobacter sp.]